jgi:predicted CoA-binding protein
MAIEAEILRTYHTIAVVGLTANPSKPSHYVSAYMREQGYRIIPVNPAENEVFGLKAYRDLASVPEQVEFVDVFRRPEFCADVARAAVAAGAKALWLQSGITSAEARTIAESAGLNFVEDRCVMVEHRRSGIGRVG